jgi:hypothetical protein
MFDFFHRCKILSSAGRNPTESAITYPACQSSAMGSPPHAPQRNPDQQSLFEAPRDPFRVLSQIDHRQYSNCI